MGLFNLLGELLGTKKVEQWIEEAQKAEANGDYVYAEKAYSRALEMADETKSWGPAATAAYGAGRACERQNKNALAEKHYTKAFRTWEDSEEWEHSAQALMDLSALLRTQRRLPEAEQLYRYALKMLLEKFPNEDPRVIETNRALAACLIEKKSYFEAEGVLSRLIAAAESNAPHPMFIPETLCELARCYKEQGKEAETETALLRAHQLYDATPDLSVDKYGVKAAACAHELARCLVRQNKADQAKPIYAKAVELAELHPGYLGEGELVDEAKKYTVGN